MEISTGQGLVIVGLLYLANTGLTALVGVWMQSRRLASEERQAEIAANVALGGTFKVESSQTSSGRTAKRG